MKNEKGKKKKEKGRRLPSSPGLPGRIEAPAGGTPLPYPLHP